MTNAPLAATSSGLRPAAVPRLDDPVLNHLRRGFPRLESQHTVAQALENLRRQPLEGRLVYFYVLDERERLVGVVPARRLLLGALDRRVEDLMVSPAVSIPASATVHEACEFFMRHRLLALPVVDGEGTMLGVVDVELYTDELADLERGGRSDDLFQLVGVRLSEASQKAWYAGFASRFPWLLCNVGGGLVAALLSGLFADDLQAVVQLALFIPIVLALSESVSVQSVSLALQIMAGRAPTWAGLVRAVRREMLTGGMLGAGCGLLVGAASLVWLGMGPLALCLLLTITLGVTFSSALGLTLPLAIRLLQRDPRVAAGPVALALADTVTLVTYLGLARSLVVP
jgi:magnesium transporter